MNILVGAMVGLIVLILITLPIIYIILLKRDIIRMKNQLKDMQITKSGSRITSSTMDKAMVELTKLINDIIVEQAKEVEASEQANRELKQAITNVSHDFRTPLTSALGYVQILKYSELSKEKQEAYIMVVESRIKTLIVLIEELFEFTQMLENIEVEIPTPQNANNVLRDVLSYFYEDFSVKKITPEICITTEPLYLYSTESSLKRIFQNLIKNSLEHGVGDIKITLDVEKKQIRVQNKVAPDKMFDVTKLFDRFYISDPARTGKSTGLGLSITKELVLRMGGTIEATYIDDTLAICIQFI